MGVLLFHLWPHRLAGGYVGVDVFFVVSGFLITDHLLREKSRTGKIALARFWARRARRLLPASLVVLLATALSVWLWVPDTRWAQFGSEIIASTLYVENWALAGQSVDYMAQSNVESPVQHFWSLGVEEQFYLVWPLLLVGGYLISRRLGRKSTAGAAAVVAAVVVLSLGYSIYLTAVQPSVAYFSTFTRAWEFGLGALLAVAVGRGTRVLDQRLATFASWLGFALIAASMLTFTGETPFPSFYALLPVVGTLLVIIAGAPSSAFAPTRLFSVRPVQFVGDVSYGTYLWHWPIIVILPFALGAPLSTTALLLVLVASIALGWVSKRVIEDPVRTSSVAVRSKNAWTFVAMLAAMAVVAAAAFPLSTYIITAPQPSRSSEQPPCYGATSMIDEECGPAEEVPLVSSLASFSVDLPPADILACEPSALSADYARCDFGMATGSGPQVALIGDSHATRWVEPLRVALEERGGTLSTFIVSGCAMLTPELAGSAWGYEQEYAEQCQDKATRIHAEVAADADIDTVVLTNRTRLYVTDNAAFRPLDRSGVQAVITQLQDAGKTVLTLKDPPERYAVPPQGGQSAADCLAAAALVSDCSLARSDADFSDPVTSAATATGVPVLDMDDLFCLSERCLSRIGGLVVYSDDNHMSRSFALSTAGILGTRFDDATR